MKAASVIGIMYLSNNAPEASWLKSQVQEAEPAALHSCTITTPKTSIPIIKAPLLHKAGGDNAFRAAADRRQSSSRPGRRNQILAGQSLSMSINEGSAGVGLKIISMFNPKTPHIFPIKPLKKLSSIGPPEPTPGLSDSCTGGHLGTRQKLFRFRPESVQATLDHLATSSIVEP